MPAKRWLHCAGSCLRENSPCSCRIEKSASVQRFYCGTFAGFIRTPDQREPGIKVDPLLTVDPVVGKTDGMDFHGSITVEEDASLFRLLN